MVQQPCSTFCIRCGNRLLHLGQRVHVMGILNVTPDSFSDGGRFMALDQAIERAEWMIEEGVDLIDVGGESSRPGADPIPAGEEMKRVLPVIKALAERISVPISIDTYRAEVALQAIRAGASLINDISALRFDQGMLLWQQHTMCPWF